MATFSKILLSGSTNGKQILVTSADADTADTIHTAVTGTTDFDEVWLYVANNHTETVLLTVLWGGDTDPNDFVQVSVLSKDGRHLVCDGKLLQNALVVKAFASVENVLVIDGFVNRIAA